MANDESDSDRNTRAERRASERRWVMLRIVIEDQGNIAVTKTINVSETGILIESSPDLKVEKDQILHVVLEGLIPEDETPRSREMLVVRVEEQAVALTYID